MLDSGPRIIAIGGSAGAVDAVKALCGSLSPELAAAVCIVIHVGARGLNVLANIFDNACPFPVRTAEDGEKLEPGWAYIAPAERACTMDQLGASHSTRQL